ncbi:retrovirus-related pol polyprotein LINE-1 [Tanacetum coccineum]
MGRILFIPFQRERTEGREEVVTPSILPQFDCYYSRISKTALQKMGRNKAVGPNKIPIEAWRSLGDEGIIWLTSLFNKIFTSAKMPEEWRLSEVIPIFKNKGDAQVCSNYKGIKLLSHTMKLWERVIERRLRRETTVSENQERQRDLHLAFLDLEKAYDSVPRELIWKTLVDKGTSRRYIKVIKDMYDGAKTRVRTSIGNTEFFPIVGLHQGSAISPYLFALILDELSREIQEDIPWCLIFADDIALVSKSAEDGLPFMFSCPSMHALVALCFCPCCCLPVVVCLLACSFRILPAARVCLCLPARFDLPANGLMHAYELQVVFLYDPYGSYVALALKGISQIVTAGVVEVEGVRVVERGTWTCLETEYVNSTIMRVFTESIDASLLDSVVSIDSVVSSLDHHETR